MKISIITPSYNQGQFIEDAIISVLNQHYTDFEHIIVDNCSTDNTLEVVRKYPHLIWISEPDEGQSDALNKGFARSTGDIIGWLNCDDFYLEGAFEQVVSALSEEALDGVYSDLQFCDINKKVVKHYKSHRPVKFLSLFHAFISSECFFFKRRIIQGNLLVQKDMHYCMDQDFAARVLYGGFKVSYLNTCFAVFRWQGKNKSLNTPEMRKNRLKEGIIVFNRHNRLLHVNADKKLNQFLYNCFRNLLKPYRLYLKLTT